MSALPADYFDFSSMSPFDMANYKAVGYANPYFPNSDRWRGLKWPATDHSVDYIYSDDPDNTYMTGWARPHLPEPTKYESWQRSQYKYITAPPRKWFGTAQCRDGEVVQNQCAPGHVPVCKSDSGTRATCLQLDRTPNEKFNHDYNCHYGYGSQPAQWSPSNQL